jgi:hypothetical protein
LDRILKVIGPKELPNTEWKTITARNGAYTINIEESFNGKLNLANNKSFAAENKALWIAGNPGIETITFIVVAF